MRWQSSCTNHALRQNIILVHKTQDSPIFYHGSLRNDYKILKKNKKQRLYKAKLLRNKIGIKTGKNQKTQLDKILHRFLQEGTECT